MLNFKELNRAIAPGFNRAAPESIRWASERVFFENAIRNCKVKIQGADRPVLIEALERGDEHTIESVRSAAHQVAAMGLTLNPAAKLVYFVPRRAREIADGEKWSDYHASVPWNVDPTPSYMGLAHIATHYAACEVFGSIEVYQADGFELRGPFELPYHRPTMDNTLRDEKVAIGAYAACILKSGRARTEYVDAPTIQRIRGLSKLKNSLMYTTVWTEGWKKIAVRRLAKLTMQAEPRMVAAEAAMRSSEGYTFDEAGNIVPDAVDVPRGTSEAETEPRGGKPRGMAGLRTKLDTAATRTQDPEQPVGVGPQQHEPPPLLALPAPSKHREGTIEWFLDQTLAADTFQRLDDVKAAALSLDVDKSDFADSFRKAFKKRRGELREGE